MFEPIDFDGYHGLNINFGPNGQDILSNIVNKSKLETPHKTTFWLLLQKKKKKKTFRLLSCSTQTST